MAACVPEGAKNWPFSIGPQTYAVALGDLDNDGDLDAFLANGENEVPVPNTIWFNDGSGNFRDSGQQIGDRESRNVLLADLDTDPDSTSNRSTLWPLAILMVMTTRISSQAA